MYKKTRIRQILELMQKDLSEREIAKTLSVSRNSIARIRQGCEEQQLNIKDILMMNDEDLYHLFYPGKFKRTRSYVQVNYARVHSELKKGRCNRTSSMGGVL